MSKKKGEEYMISNELKNIVDKLNKQGKMSFIDGTLEEQIVLFEKEKKK